jgi:type IV pilus assembly protein PilP
MKRVVLVALATFLLAGCAQQDMRDLKDFIAEVKAREPGPLPPLPEMRQVEPFLYSAAGRRDPFQPQEEVVQAPVAKPSGGPTPDFNRRKEELESYSLDTLRMVGTLEQEGDVWGLVQTRDGTIHRVRTGNYMGLNHGQIVRISEDKIELSELLQDGAGGYVENSAALGLGEE